ncbi:hypothetical protein Mapa_003975 [Marchantia paleacea]|nr:hypothetical protein Mapa_003975 [Marchantia paleacea]
MDWNASMMRNQFQATNRDVRLESTVRAWWEDVLYTQRWIEQPRPRWNAAYFTPRLRWKINTTTLAVTYDILARITGLTFLVTIWFRFVQQSSQEECQDCCIPWSTVFSDLLKNLNSFTCLFGGGLNWWIGVYGADNLSEHPIVSSIPELAGKFFALWVVSKFTSGRDIFKGELGLVQFLLISVVGGFVLLLAWRIVYVGLTRAFDRIGELIGVGSTGFHDSPDRRTDPYLELGSASMRLIGMPTVARELLLFGLNTFSKNSFSFPRLVFDFKRLVIRIGMYMFCSWFIPEKIELMKLDIRIHAQKWLESPRPRWIRSAPQVRWIVDTERLAVIYDFAARTVASCFVLVLWFLFARTQQQEDRWDPSDFALTFTLLFGGAVSWYHVSLCGNLDDVVFTVRDILELLAQFLGVFWLVRQQARDLLGGVGVLYVVKCLIFSIGGGLLVFISWRKVYRNLMDGLIYNVGEWIGVRNSTFRENSAWWTDRQTQVIHSVDRFVVQPAIAREIFSFAFKFCKMNGDMGTFASLISNLKDLIVHSFVIHVVKWVLFISFNTMVNYGLLEPFFHAELTDIVQRGDAASAETSDAHDQHGLEHPAERISRSPDRDSGSEPLNLNEEPQSVSFADSEAHAVESDHSS